MERKEMEGIDGQNIALMKEVFFFIIEKKEA